MVNLEPCHLDSYTIWITESALSANKWITIKPFLILQLKTKEGLKGIGEALVLDKRETGVAAIISSLLKNLSTKNNLTPQTFKDWADKIEDKHRGIEFAAAVSAIEMALWDIQGKLKNQSLADMWGGDILKPVSIYANSWSDFKPNDQMNLDKIETILDADYRSIKIYPIQNRNLNQASQMVRLIREQVGDNIDLMVDLTCSLDFNQSIELANLIKPFNPYWYEEPMDGDRMEELASIKSQTNLPIVSGERHCGVLHFQNLIKANAVDILNPDIAGAGGIIEFFQIAEFSKKSDVLISPHCWNTMTIAATYMIHFCCAIKNVEKCEIFPDFFDHCNSFSSAGYEIIDGKAILLNKPGHGASIYEAALDQFSSFRDNQKI